MNNKLNNMVNQFLANNNTENEEELNKKLQEFIKKLNTNEIEYNNTPLDDAYELLEKAEEAKTEKLAIKYAKKAYEICPDCFDAILFQVNLEDDPLKRWDLLNKGLEKERKRLENANFFQQDNIGYFYGIFETRPYMRGLYAKANYLLLDGKIKQALNVCKEILRLNKNDNLGARYLLMAIYAYLEEEQEMLKLYKKYSEENLEMLFPLFVLYYKLGNDDLAKKYLKRINKANANFLKLFKGTIKINEDTPKGYYAIGDASEVIMYFQQYYFLINTLPTIERYILENSKNKK